MQTAVPGRVLQFTAIPGKQLFHADYCRFTTIPSKQLLQADYCSFTTIPSKQLLHADYCSFAGYSMQTATPC